jgi:protein-tyrosine-phosphatase
VLSLRDEDRAGDQQEGADQKSGKETARDQERNRLGDSGRRMLQQPLRYAGPGTTGRKLIPQSLAAPRRRNDSEDAAMSLFQTIQHRRGRVLFVTQANACRGQMAEAFARALGDDVIVAFSAGIWPADSVSEAARVVMAEKAAPIFADQTPKRLADFDLSGFDVIVNLSGCRLAAHANTPPAAFVLEPFVPTPPANDLDSHREVRNRMEVFVRFLVEHFRRAREWSAGATSRAAHQTMPSPPPATTPQPDAAIRAAF